MTVAFEIRNLVTIWHKDPEIDGSDDSCGWFMRARHGDQKLREKVKNEVQHMLREEYETKLGQVLACFHIAHLAMHGYNHGKTTRFMQKNLYSIIRFTDNPIDCIRFNENTSDVIFAWILRAERKWWKEPRWHIHHWRFQFHPFQQLRRRYWDKCSKCGKRGFKGAAIGEWNGDKIWHLECGDDE